MNSPSRGISQWMPTPGVVVTFSSPRRPLAAVGQFGARGLQLHEHVMRGAKEQVALFGEDEAAGMTVEQRDRKLLLERGDLARHRRLRQPELFAGMGEAAGLGRGVKHLELVPVHVHKSVARSHVHSAAARSGRARRENAPPRAPPCSPTLPPSPPGDRFRRRRRRRRTRPAPRSRSNAARSRHSPTASSATGRRRARSPAHGRWR